MMSSATSRHLSTALIKALVDDQPFSTDVTEGPTFQDTARNLCLCCLTGTVRYAFGARDEKRDVGPARRESFLYDQVPTWFHKIKGTQTSNVCGISAAWELAYQLSLQS
jgi:hypothetical protein